jgi:exosortase/archaeosortase family protein
MGTLAGEIRKDLPRTRLFIILFAGLLSMAFNSIRILLIVLAHLHSGLREGFETIGHITFGWWVFAIDLLVFLIALRSIPHSRLQATTSRDAKNTLTQAGKHNHLFWAAGAALALPVASPVAQTFDSFPDTPASAPSIVGMTGPISPDARWQPSYAGFAWEQRVAYITDKGRVVELYANRFHRQSQDNELIAHGRELFSSEVFQAVGQDLIGLEGGHRPTVEINRLDMRDAAGRHWLALFTYTMDNEFTTSRSQVQLATAWRGLYRRPSAGVLAVAAPCVPDCASTELDLRALMAQAMDAYTRPRGTP